jgi:hypothetical protein
LWFEEDGELASDLRVCRCTFGLKIQEHPYTILIAEHRGYGKIDLGGRMILR